MGRMELMAKQKREREARLKAKEAASSSKKKTSSIYVKPDGTPRKSTKLKLDLKVKSNKDSSIYNKPDGTPRNSRKTKINIKSNKDSSMYNKPDGTPRKNTKVTPSKSKGNASEIAKLKKQIKTGGMSMKRGGRKRQLEKRIRALGG